MFDDAFANFERQVQPGKSGYRCSNFDDAQRLEIVIEAVAERTQQFIEFSFSGVAEGRVPDVVDQRQGFGEIGIQS